jgi:hypothetical protein
MLCLQHFAIAQKHVHTARQARIVAYGIQLGKAYRTRTCLRAREDGKVWEEPMPFQIVRASFAAGPAFAERFCELSS